MRIVHITTWLHGGAGTATVRLHQELIKQGIESHVVSLASNLSPELPNHHPVPVRQTKFHEKVLNKFGIRLNSAYKNAHRIKQLQGQYEIITFHDTDYRIENLDIVRSADIIHLHWIADFINYETFFKKLSNKKIVWTLHDLNPIQGLFHYENDQLNNEKFKDLDRSVFAKKRNAMQAANHIHYICLNTWIHEKLTAKLGTGISTSILPNVINDSEFFAEKMERLDDYVNFLLIADNINNYRKGLDLAIKAIEKVRLKDKIKIFVVGRGQLQLPNDIKTEILGAVNDINTLREIYNSCDYLIIPSREDNLPNTMVEALMCGTAVISFKLGGMQEHIIDNVNGFLVQPFHVNEMSLLLEHLVRDKIRLSRVNISIAAKATFTQFLAPKYINLYKSL